nr:MAG TPA: hypothetical protein [Caudoviricetes sp.]
MFFIENIIAIHNLSPLYADRSAFMVIYFSKIT